MIHGDLVSELHIEDTASKGFRSFWRKYHGKIDDTDLYVQFTKPRSTDDKRFVGSVPEKKYPYQEPADLNTDGADSHKKMDKRLQDIQHIEKLGLEDKTIYKEPNHSDPVGLYAYPLEYVINHPYDIKYGSDCAYLRVIRVRPSANIVDLQTANYNNIERMITALNLAPKGNVTPEEAVDATYNFVPRGGNRIGHSLFFMLQHEGHLYRNKAGKVLWWGGDGESNDDNTVSTFKGNAISNNEQTKRIRKIGWDGLVDTDKEGGRAVIYSAEPEQILITSRDAYDVIDGFDLRVHKDGKEVSKGILLKRPNSNAEEMFRRGIAEKIAHLMGDKVTDTLARMSPDSEIEKNSFADAYQVMNGSDITKQFTHSSVGVIKGDPALYKTKRGFIELFIGQGFNDTDSHRGKGDTNLQEMLVTYIDDRGMSTIRSETRSASSIAKQFVQEHPQVKSEKKEPIDAKQLFTGKAAMNMLSEEMERITGSSDPLRWFGEKYYNTFLDELHQYATKCHITIPHAVTLAEKAGQYAFFRGIMAHVSPMYHHLGYETVSTYESNGKTVIANAQAIKQWYEAVDVITKEARDIFASAREIQAVGDMILPILAYSQPAVYLKKHPDSIAIANVCKIIGVATGPDNSHSSNSELSLPRLPQLFSKLTEDLEELKKVVSLDDIKPEDLFVDNTVPPMSAKEAQAVGVRIKDLVDACDSIFTMGLHKGHEDEDAKAIHTQAARIRELTRSFYQTAFDNAKITPATLNRAIPVLIELVTTVYKLIYFHGHHKIQNGYGVETSLLIPINKAAMMVERYFVAHHDFQEHIPANWRTFFAINRTLTTQDADSLEMGKDLIDGHAEGMKRKAESDARLAVRRGMPVGDRSDLIPGAWVVAAGNNPIRMFKERQDAEYWANLPVAKESYDNIRVVAVDDFLSTTQGAATGAAGAVGGSSPS